MGFGSLDISNRAGIFFNVGVSAFSTLAAAIRRRGNVGIFWRKFVPILAVCFGRVASRKSIAAHSVDLRRDYFKVHGTDAVTYSTKMIQRHFQVAAWDNFNKDLIDYAMSYLTRTFKPERRIPGFSVNVSCPQPAGSPVPYHTPIYAHFIHNPSIKFQSRAFAQGRVPVCVRRILCRVITLFTSSATVLQLVRGKLGQRFFKTACATTATWDRISLGHRNLLQVNDGLWVQRFVPLCP